MHRRLPVLLLTTLSALSVLSGCARVETGSIGILRHWNGEISTQGYTGFKFTVLDTMVAEIDTTETRYPIHGLRPSDANGVLLDGLTIIVSFRLHPDKVAPFYIQTKELDEFTDDTGHKVTTLGVKILENIVQHAVQEQTKRQTLGTLASNLGQYEKDILALAQRELDAGYPGVYQLIRVNVNHFVPPDAILQQANKTAALASEVERNAQELKLLAQRTALEEGKAKVEAAALRAAVDASRLSPEQLIAWKNARAYEMQAAALGARAGVVIEAGKAPGK